MPYRNKRDSQRSFFGKSESDEEYDRDWKRPDQGTTPLNCERRVTDKCCLIVFLLSGAFMVFMLIYASIHGNLETYFGFTDYSGNICGKGQAVQAEPFMYMCQDGNGGLDQDHPICVTECPTSSRTQTYCPGTLSQASHGVDDYPTKPYAGKLCMPINPSLQELVKSKISSQPGIKFFLMVAEILEDLWPICIAAVIAVLLGFAHLWLLRRFGMCFVWIGFIAMIGVPLVLGVKLIVASFHGGIDSILIGGEQGTYIVGVCCVLLAICLTCLVGCEWRDLLLARYTTKAAVECIFDTLSLLFEPFIALTIRGFIFVGLVVGFLLLTTCEGWELAWSWPTFMVLYVVISLWILQVCSSMSQFVAACVAEEWFFATYNVMMYSKDVEPGAMGKAYCLGLRYHLGTLAYSACILPLTHGIRGRFRCCAQAEHLNNAIGRCIRGCCRCCINCYHHRLEALNRSVYFELALNGLPFSPAARHALEVLSDDATDVLSMHGAAWLIELGGAGGITAICVALTHLMCTVFSPFSDAASPYHVANPVLVDMVAACICCPIAFHFLLVVVHVSDCILFCCAVERSRNPVRSMLSDAGTGLMSTFSVCTSERDKKESWGSSDADHLPNTRALLNMVTRERDRDREAGSQKDSGMCSGRCTSRDE